MQLKHTDYILTIFELELPNFKTTNTKNTYPKILDVNTEFYV